MGNFEVTEQRSLSSGCDTRIYSLSGTKCTRQQPFTERESHSEFSAFFSAKRKRSCRTRVKGKSHAIN